MNEDVLPLQSVPVVVGDDLSFQLPSKENLETSPLTKASESSMLRSSQVSLEADVVDSRHTTPFQIPKSVALFKESEPFSPPPPLPDGDITSPRVSLDLRFVETDIQST